MVLEVCRLVLKINQVDLLRPCSCSIVGGVGGLSSTVGGGGGTVVVLEV